MVASSIGGKWDLTNYSNCIGVMLIKYENCVVGKLTGLHDQSCMDRNKLDNSFLLCHKLQRRQLPATPADLLKLFVWIVYVFCRRLPVLLVEFSLLQSVWLTCLPINCEMVIFHRVVSEIVMIFPFIWFHNMLYMNMCHAPVLQHRKAPQTI